MTSFVNVEITANEQELAEVAKAKLIELVEASGVVGYELAEADLETILIDVLASMALTAAQIAAVVPAAIFRQFGTQLLKLPFNEGAAATGTTKWTIVPEAAVRHISAGTTIEAGGLGYEVEVETEVPASASSVSLQVIGVEKGTEYNGVSGVAQQTNPLNYVTEVQIVGETSGGAGEESDEEYLSRLAATLTLQAPRPITAENYATFVLDVPRSVLPSGVVVGRATAIDGYNGATNEPEAKVTNGSVTMTEVTSFTGITAGTEIVGSGVPVGATVVSFNSGAKEITMSAKATSSPAKTKYKMVGSYENQRYVTTFVIDKSGKALSSTAMKDIEEWLKGFREINFKTPVAAPTENEVFVKAKIHILPEYTSATVKANVESAVKEFLNPAKWGNPTAATTGSNQWLNYVNGVRLYGIVRYNQVLGVIENTPGVAYVFAGSAGLAIGLTFPATETNDIAMVGPAPLPSVGGITVNVE
jgi:hypothetical protein